MQASVCGLLTRLGVLWSKPVHVAYYVQRASLPGYQTILCHADLVCSNAFLRHLMEIDQPVK